MYTPDSRPSGLVKDELSGNDSATPIPIEGEIEEAMEGVVDPELMVDVVDLDLLCGVTVDEEANVTFGMTLTSPTCPLTDRIEYGTKYVLDGLANSVTTSRVWLPPWTLEMITEDGRKQPQAIGYNL